jgi:hypothetical protein
MLQLNQSRRMSIRPPPKGSNQPDLFATTFADIPIRDQRYMMERPFFSLAEATSVFTHRALLTSILRKHTGESLTAFLLRRCVRILRGHEQRAAGRRKDRRPGRL